MPNWVTTIAYMGACRKRIGGCRAILVCTEKRRVCERSTSVQVVMTFPGVSQPESNDYFPHLAKNRIAFDHVFFDLFSIIAF